MGSGIKVWTINSLADVIIRDIIEGSVADIVSKERISKRFGIISRAIVAHKKTLRVSQSQASMIGFREMFWKMENLRKIVFYDFVHGYGSDRGSKLADLGRKLANSNPNIVSMQDGNKHGSGDGTIIVPIVAEYVRWSYFYDNGYTGSNLEFYFPQTTADSLTVRCPGLNLKTDVQWYDAAPNAMARCRSLSLTHDDVVENGPYPSVKIIHISGTFSHLESLRSFSNLETVQCVFGHGDKLIGVAPIPASNCQELELAYCTNK